MKEEKILNIRFIIMAIVCICLVSIAIVPKPLQNDTFYTIKLGELILENGIDMQEHFAWHEGLPYTYPHWLYDVIIYLIYAIGGFTGIYISSIIFTIALGVTMYLTNVKLSKNVYIPFILTVAIIYIGREFFTARAQLLTFILFVLEIYYIESFLETKKKRFAIGLLIIPVVIANIHAAVFPFYFILYLPYIAEYIISLFINANLLKRLLLKIDLINIKKLEKKERLSSKKTKELEILKNRVEKNRARLEKNKVKEPYKIIVKHNKNDKWLIVIMLLAALTGLITPIGDTPYTYLYNTMQGTTTDNINEHLPIVLYEAKNTFGFIAISICLLSFTKSKLRLSEIFLLGGLMFLTIMSRRQQSMLFFIGIIVVNKMISQLMAKINKDTINEILKYLTSIIFKTLIYIIFAIFMVMCLNKTKNVEIVSKKTYPIEATEYIKNNLNVENIRLFNEYNFGSYLLFKDIPVFIDSRADVYDPAFNGWKDDIFRDFINLTKGVNNYETKFEHYGITHLLIYSNSTLDRILRLNDNYNSIYNDGRFVLYERLSAKK